MTVKTRFAVNALLSALVFSIILFVSAGTMDYPQGWLYLATTVTTAIMNVLGIRINTELMRERMKPGEGAKSWDKALLGISLLFFLSTIILAGLDSGRFRLTPDLPWAWYGLGVLLMIAGQFLFLTARNENQFFSAVVRIQTDRGHAVCDSGVYGKVRHPGYVGMIISTLGLPLVLGSFWSAIPSLLSVVVLIVRTYLEDETLKKELHGYEEYAQRTRYRLVPLVW